MQELGKTLAMIHRAVNLGERLQNKSDIAKTFLKASLKQKYVTIYVSETMLSTPTLWL